MSLLRVCGLLPLPGMIVCGVIGVLAAGPLSAAAVGNLYEASVSVTGQAEVERSRAIGDGFRQMLVKVSGQRSVLALPAVQEEFNKAAALLESYRYETVPVRQSASPADAAAGPLRLRLAFDPAGVRALLNRAGAPIWGSSRPTAYLVVASQVAGRAVRAEASEPRLLMPGTAQIDTLLAVAAERGMPLVVSASGMDVASVLSGAVSSAVTDAAARAGAKVVLQIVLAGGAGSVRATGTLRVDGASEPVEAVGRDEQTALREVMHQAADRLGARYAVVARVDQLRLVRLRVSGVNTLLAHAGIEGWLGNLPLAKDVVIERVSGEQVHFLVTLAGDIAQLRQAMATDGRFADIGQPITDDGGNVAALDVSFAGSGALPGGGAMRLP